MLNPPSPESAQPAPLSAAVPWGQAMTTIGLRSGIDLFVQAPGKPAPIAKTMAYGSGQAAPNAHVTSQLHRLRRGFPYQRGGTAVVPIPQFKALTIYSHTLSNRAAPNPFNNHNVPAAFQNTTNPGTVAGSPTVAPVYSWPIGARKA